LLPDCCVARLLPGTEQPIGVRSASMDFEKLGTSSFVANEPLVLWAFEPKDLET
jgi:hypothetical protein